MHGIDWIESVQTGKFKLGAVLLVAKYQPSADRSLHAARFIEPDRDITVPGTGVYNRQRPLTLLCLHATNPLPSGLCKAGGSCTRV